MIDNDADVFVATIGYNAEEWKVFLYFFCQHDPINITMQLMPRYLVSNRINLVADVAGFIVEYRPVYSRQVQVYKGIENVLQFRLLNADQRPINVASYTPKFVAFDENNNLIIERDCITQDDGSSATKGLFSLTVTENDLLNIKQQYLKYNVYLVDAAGEKILTYNHSNFDNDATIFVNVKTFPGPKAAYNISSFQRVSVDTQEWTSETVDAQPALNGNEALHTAAIYTNSYVGTVAVQATLDNIVNETTNWATIQTIEFDGTETEPAPVNFNGVFSHLRFAVYSDPSNSVTKILIKN